MPKLPLSSLRFNRESHPSALKWSLCLLLGPVEFEKAALTLSPREKIVAAASITFHIWLYIIATSILVRWIIFGWLGVAMDPEGFDRGFWENRELSASVLWTHAEVLIAVHMIGLGIVIAYSVLWNLSLSWRILSFLLAGLTIGRWYGSVHGTVAGLVAGLSLGPAIGIFARRLGYGFGLIMGPAAATLFAASAAVKGYPPGGLLIGTAAGVIFGLVGGTCASLGVISSRYLFFPAFLFIPTWYLLGSMIAFDQTLFVGTIGFIAAYVITSFRLPNLLIHFALLPLLLSKSSRRYFWHPVTWDSSCILPFPHLHKILIRLSAEEPALADREIDRLIETYPSQKTEAIRARVKLVAVEAERVDSLAELSLILASLPKHLELYNLQQSVQRISRLQIELQNERRLHVRKEIAKSIFRKVSQLRDGLPHLAPTFALDFTVAVDAWLNKSAEQLEKARARAGQERAPQVFNFTRPVVLGTDAFIRRVKIISEVEHQLTSKHGSALLTISGRRRMGKTTLLSNLAETTSIRLEVAAISMQDPRAFGSLESFLGLIVDRIRHCVPGVVVAPGDLSSLFSYLIQVDETLEDSDDFLLLGFDEFENIDRKISQGIFPEDFLAVVREAGQSLRRIRWAFVGTTPAEELKGADWPSYLVGGRTIEVGPFDLSETYLLLTEPKSAGAGVVDSVIFEPAFWGPGGIEVIHTETGGWPHLVQLVAESAIDLVNAEGKARADAGLLEDAISSSVRSGDMAFYNVVKGECRLPGEWEYFQRFRESQALPRPTDMSIVNSLKVRRLVFERNGNLQLVAPIMARWLRERY